ncbi:MAG: nucleotidyltransferase family protein [Betaproteobacteria bacterium]|nr:nucleotidyltransferase family protein [Betaproteobacteria bacterium]
MRVMILAAGRGERMRPLTDTTPKALLPVGGKPLIVWHLERLKQAGFSRVLINLAHLGDQIQDAIGDGANWNLSIVYSQEPPGALETAGGIARVLPLLGDHPFLVINADVFCDWPLESARITPMQNRLAHLLLVDNPAHNPTGDFSLDRQGNVQDSVEDRLTYAGIGIYSPALFKGLDPDTPARLAPLLHDAAPRGLVGGEHYGGFWFDVGTPERLRDLNRILTPTISSNEAMPCPL